MWTPGEFQNWSQVMSCQLRSQISPTLILTLPVHTSAMVVWDTVRRIMVSFPFCILHNFLLHEHEPNHLNFMSSYTCSKKCFVESVKAICCFKTRSGDRAHMLMMRWWARRVKTVLIFWILALKASSCFSWPKFVQNVGEHNFAQSQLIEIRFSTNANEFSLNPELQTGSLYNQYLQTTCTVYVTVQISDIILVPL